MLELSESMSPVDENLMKTKEAEGSTETWEASISEWIL